VNLAESLGFVAFSFLIIVSSISMLTTERVVHSAMYLLAAMLGVAGILILLEAQFLAFMQVMIYAGAVMVLVLFTIMLTMTRVQELERRQELLIGPGWPQFILVVIFTVLLYVVLGSRPRPFAPVALVATDASAEHIGRLLFTTYVLPFELASLVLLVALIGAIFIAKEDGG
jgi:NADH-quinone oxidoreductase subunit J